MSGIRLRFTAKCQITYFRFPREKKIFDCKLEFQM